MPGTRSGRGSVRAVAGLGLGPACGTTARIVRPAEGTVTSKTDRNGVYIAGARDSIGDQAQRPATPSHTTLC